MVSGGERMQVARDVEPERETEDLATTQPPADLVLRIALADAEVFLEQLGQGPVGDSLAVRETASSAPQRFRIFVGQSVPQLADESCLPNACFADDRDEHRLRASGSAAEGDVKPLELRIPADEGAGKPANTARTHQRQCAQNAATGDATRLSLRLDRLWRTELERAPDGPDGALARKHLARLRCLLESCGDVDRIAADERAALARPAAHHLTGID